MTLVIAAKGIDFIVTGADSRGLNLLDIGGWAKRDEYEKMVPLSKYCVAEIYGEAGPAMYVLEKFQEVEKDLDSRSVVKITEELARMCRTEMEKALTILDKTKNPIRYGFIIAGLDKEGGEHRRPKIYQIHSEIGFCPSPSSDYLQEGDPVIARYALRKGYRKGMTVDELTTLVCQALYDTSVMNPDVGGDLKVAIINKDGIRRMQREDIQNAVEKWDEKR